jgi:hypothetical protein
VPFEELKLGEKLGEGTFGKVGFRQERAGGRRQTARRWKDAAS